jgi:hypothetical protein
MTWCLTADGEVKLLEELKKDGNPQKMADRSPEKRHEWFANILGEEAATKINGLYEGLLVKNQKTAAINLIKKLGGSKVVQRDMLSKVQALEKALDKAGIKELFKDLLRVKLNIDPTKEQYDKLVEYADTVEEVGKVAKIDTLGKMSNKERFDFVHNKETGKANNEALMKYGRAVIAFDNYSTQLKQEAASMTLKEQLGHPLEFGKKIVSSALDASKASKASMDDSALLNQGFPTLANALTANIWKNNAIDSLQNMVKTIGGQEAWDEIRAYAVSRPNYITGMYKKANLAVMVTEEDFPKSVIEATLNLPQSIVGKITPEDLKSGRIYKTFEAVKLGKLYKASEVAFSGFQLKNRLDVFDLFLSISDKFNQKITLATVHDTGLGQLVNSLTARGSLGKLEPVGNIINAPFFSLRKFVATAEGFFFYQPGKKSTYVRGLGIMARLQEILLVAVILGIAKMLKKDSVEEDPTSADYGKIKIGDTRFIIDEKASLTTLAMRIVEGKYKSSTTGEISEINTGKFGSKTSMDLLEDFSESKLSPFSAQLVEIINRQTREGNKPTVGSVLKGMYAPLGIENIIDTLKNPKAANLVAITIADFFGIPTNTYSGSNLMNQYLPEGAIITNDSFIETINTYAKANNVNTDEAFNKMFAGQMVISVDKDHVTVIKEGEQVSKVSGGKVIVERMSVAKSTAAKKAAQANNPKMKLDHIVPLEFGVNNGGNNSPSNQRMVTTSEWSSYTKVENALGKALKNGKISGEEAVKQIKYFKSIADAKRRKIYGDDLINKYK